MAAVCGVRIYHTVRLMRKNPRLTSVLSSLLYSRPFTSYLRPNNLAFYNEIKTNVHRCKFSSRVLTKNRQIYRFNVNWRPGCLSVLQFIKIPAYCTKMQTTVAKPEQESTEKQESSKTVPPPDFSARAMKYTLVGFGLLFSGISGFLVMSWGSEVVDEEGHPIKDEFSEMPVWKGHLLRTWREINYYDKLIKEPSREKLLPDPLTEPYYQPPYTLVLEMTGVLVHPDWTYKTGWRFKKRPGVDYFLQQIGPPLYEVVIYTSEQGFTAFPILDTLDPNGFIMYRLFRDATRYTKGHHIKDLSCLNRDLTKVIFIDWNEKSFQMQPENALKLKKWQGNDEDRSLIDLAAFLRTIATSQVDDVRSVLSFYKQFDDPLVAFKENQRRLQEEQERLGSQTELAERSMSWTKSFFKRWQQ